MEADVTYYRVPSSKMVEGWNRKTPDDFVLAAKFPRSIVHAGEERLPDEKRLLNPTEVGDDLERFLAAMSILGDKCGPLILQFPYFNKKVFTGPEPFLERLDSIAPAWFDQNQGGIDQIGDPKFTLPGIQYP